MTVHDSSMVIALYFYEIYFVAISKNSINPCK